MRRADRLFEIIQALRGASGPVTAADLAQRLEVTVRTVYRDMAALQAQRVPIEGAAGIGYVLRRGFDLPPLMLTPDEVDAIAVGARFVRRLRDPALQEAALSVLAKVAQVVPAALRQGMLTPSFYVTDLDAEAPLGADPAELRRAIRESRKAAIDYRDEHGQETQRTIWPIALAYYVDATILGAWCELRGDYRQFRVERIVAAEILEQSFPARGGKLAQDWLALLRE